MPIFPFDRARAVARNVKAIVGSEGNDVRRNEGERGGASRADLHEEIRTKRQELREAKDRVKAGGGRAETIAAKKDKKRVQQEIFRLRREFRAVGGKRKTSGPVTGALPDFVVIGAMKGGTTWLYHLLTRHPHVEPAAAKELHYFDVVCEDEGVEWYRGCFPKPRTVDGRTTITGEATPYLSHPLAPGRMAGVIPQARLICVLRNPVDRAYSHYQQVARKGREKRTFGEAVEEEMDQLAVRNGAADADDTFRGYLYKGFYVDQLVRWSRHFGDKQMLVLKSEDFFGSAPETLRTVYEYLDLPERLPEDALQERPDRRRNEGKYRRGVDPAVREQLEELFEPHNRRLYDYLGRDFGW